MKQVGETLGAAEAGGSTPPIDKRRIGAAASEVFSKAFGA